MERMNRNKKHNDWTDALRDRLQDASLPLADGWTAPEGAAVPARPERHWAGWGWALAGVAAVLAAVLLLRPAQPAGPEPVRLVEAPAAGTPAADDAPDLLVAQAQTSAQPAVGKARLSSAPPAKVDSPAKTALPSSETARNEDAPANTTLPSSEQTQNEEDPGKTDRPYSKRVPDEDKAARNGVAAGQRSLEAVSRADVAAAGDPEPAWPDTGERAGHPRRPVSLRLQAAGPGVSLASGGGTTSNTPQSDVPYSNSDKTIGGPQPAGTPGPASRQSVPFPFSLGVSAALPLSRSWAVAAGLDYTQRAGALSAAAAGRASAQSLTLHYLGLPVDLHYYFNPESRLRVYLGGGLKAEKCIYVTGAEPLRDPVLWSWNLQAGADLRVLPGVRLYVAPAVTKYLNHSAYTAGWDDGPVISLRAGLSFDLK